MYSSQDVTIFTIMSDNDDGLDDGDDAVAVDNDDDKTTILEAYFSLLENLNHATRICFESNRIV